MVQYIMKSIAILFSLAIMLITQNIFAQQAKSSFVIDQNFNTFQVLDNKTGESLFSGTTAGFKYNGEWFFLEDLKSKSKITSKTIATFGDGEKLSWVLVHPSKKN